MKKNNRRKAGHARNSRARSEVDDLKRNVMHGAEVARKKIDNFGKKANRYIDKNPKKAAAIAAGVGAVVGAALLATSKRKEKAR